VHDLTAAMNAVNSSGSVPYEPHPWGGVPGIFKQFTVEAGLDYDMLISARNAASLRGHFLNTNPPGWDLLGNIASQKWGAVVLQDLSDEPLPLLNPYAADALTGWAGRPLVGRQPAREQVRLVPARAHAVRHHHRDRSAEDRLLRHRREGPGDQPPRCVCAAADRGPATGLHRRARAGFCGAGRRCP
jgi:hypothetical protein